MKCWRVGVERQQKAHWFDGVEKGSDTNTSKLLIFGVPIFGDATFRLNPSGRFECAQFLKATLSWVPL